MLHETDGHTRRQRAIDAAQAGTLIWHLDDDRLEADARALELLGVSGDADVGLDTVLRTVVKPDDASRFRRAVEKAAGGASGNRRLHDQLCVTLPDGSDGCVGIRGEVIVAGDPPRPVRVVALVADAMDECVRKRELSSIQADQAVLLVLSDALRSLTDPFEIQQAAVRVLGDYLGASRVTYCEAESVPDGFVVGASYCAPGTDSVVGRHSAFDFGASVTGRLCAGQTVVIDDTATDQRLSDDERLKYAPIDVQAWVGAPLLRAADNLAVVVVQQSTARTWTAEEIGLIETAADRIISAIERGRTEIELRRSESLLRSVFASINDAYCIVELVEDETNAPIDVRLVDMNPELGRLTGLRIGQTVRGAAPDLYEIWIERLASVARTGVPFRGENDSSVLGRYWDVFINPIEPPRRLVVVFRDVTPHRQAEQRERFRTAFADELRPLSDPTAVQGVAARLLGEHLGASRVFYAEPSADGNGITVRRDYTDGVKSMVGSYAWERLSATGLGRLHAGETWISVDARASLTDDQAVAFKDEYAIGAIVTVPLLKDASFGALLIVHDANPRQWTDDEISLIEEVAERTWGAIDRARAEQHRLEMQEEEHRVSLGLQRALLPESVLQHPEVAIAARYEARSQLLEVGGDWYDSFTLPGGLIAIAAGDVVGHGLEAAATMGKLRVATAALARHADGPGRLLSQLDDFTAGADGTEFATACFATFDPNSGELRFASAGHPPMLMIDAGGNPHWLTGGRSGPLVRDVDHDRPEATITLEPGALLILYSDGLIERRGEPIATGLDRLQRAATALGDASVEQACDRLFEAMGVDGSREDDVVVVCLRVPPRVVARFRRTLPALAGELRPLREGLHEWLSIHGMESVASTLVLAVGEACANAIEHAYAGGPHGPIEVAIDQHEGDTLSVTVRDFGRWRTPAETGEHEGHRGRGMGIMSSLTTDFHCESGEHGTIVRFELGARS